MAKLSPRWSKEEIMSRVVVDESGCWLWQGTLNPAGYGPLQRNGKKTAAHRVSYELFVDRIPPKKLVCHRCDVRHCVNPEHLFVGTHKDNTRDMHRKGRGRAKITWEQAQKIRDEYDGTTQFRLDMAAKYGVTESNIQWIVYGQSWKWVPK